MTEYLEILRQSPEFQSLLKEIGKQRPVLPVHNYDPDNTEQWKALSHQQRGFDFAMSLFGESYE